MTNDEWISAEEAAKLSGYHHEHIRRQLRQGKIKGQLKGGMYWVSKNSLLQFLREAKESHIRDKRHGPKGR